MQVLARRRARGRPLEQLAVSSPWVSPLAGPTCSVNNALRSTCVSDPAPGCRGEMEASIVHLFTLRVLGGLEVRTADGRDVTPPGRKMRALFACLALPPGSTWSREQLIALLW